MAKKTKSKKFKGAVSRNAAKQQRGASFGHLKLPKNIPVFKEEPGSRVDLDIMPYVVTTNNHPDRDDEYEIAVPGSLWYKRPYWLHRSVGPENQSVVCPSSIGQKCPICEYRAQLLKDGADWNDDSVKALKPSMRNLYVVIPKGNKKLEEKPHVWDISQFLFQEKLNEEIGENEDYETFPDLEEGWTLRIRFSEESFGSNKFAETSRIDFKERDKPYKESILDEIPSLDDLLEIPSYKTIEAIFFGGVDIDDVADDDYEDEVSKPSRSRKTSKIEEDDDEDDYDTNDIDEEESDDDDLDEDNDDDEEDMDEDEDEPEDDDEDLDEEDDGEDEDDDEPEDDEEDDEEDDDDEDDEDDEEEEPVKPAKPARRTKTKAAEDKKTKGKAKDKAETKAKDKKGSKANKCPHGYKFGDDCEEYDECDTCKNWESCMDASEGR